MMRVIEEEHAAWIASVPEALQRAVRAHVRIDQQLEVLLDIAGVLQGMRERGESARVAEYVSATIASLSRDREASDLI